MHYLARNFYSSIRISNSWLSSYIEELVKLSSGIMHRVKTSDYYINDNNAATITEEQ